MSSQYQTIIFKVVVALLARMIIWKFRKASVMKRCLENYLVHQGLKKKKVQEFKTLSLFPREMDLEKILWFFFTNHVNHTYIDVCNMSTSPF